MYVSPELNADLWHKVILQKFTQGLSLHVVSLENNIIWCLISVLLSDHIWVLTTASESKDIFYRTRKVISPEIIAAGINEVVVTSPRKSKRFENKSFMF